MSMKQKGYAEGYKDGIAGSSFQSTWERAGFAGEFSITGMVDTGFYDWEEGYKDGYNKGVEDKKKKK